jgi:hypothetical protein
VKCLSASFVGREARVARTRSPSTCGSTQLDRGTRECPSWIQAEAASVSRSGWKRDPGRPTLFEHVDALGGSLKLPSVFNDEV